MTTRELMESGAHRDGHLEVENFVRKSGPVAEDFVQMRIKLDGPMYRQTGPDLRHILTGTLIEEDLAPAAVRKKWPHGFTDWVPDDPDQLMHLYSEEAFGATCCPKTVSRLYQFMNDPGRFAALAKAWGCDTVKMLPGKRPGSDDGDGKTKNKGDGTNNPFDPNNKRYASDDVRITEIGKFIRAFGSRAAATSAAKYGVDLAGRPLRTKT